MNYLWFMTYSLQKSGGDPKSPINLLMLAQAILEVTGDVPGSKDSATSSIISELTGGSIPPAAPTAGSPAAIAKAFLANPQDAVAQAEMMNTAESLQHFGNTVNNWWGSEGMYHSGATIDPGSLTQADVQNLVTEIQVYQSKPSTDGKNQGVYNFIWEVIQGK